MNLNENSLTFVSNINIEPEALLDSIKLRLFFTEAPGSGDTYSTPWIAVPREMLVALQAQIAMHIERLQVITQAADGLQSSNSH